MGEAARVEIAGVVLAGGRARRMGGEDKGLLPLAGKPMIAWVLEALAPQVDSLIINANRNLARYEAFGWPVVPDVASGFAGPLAGMASAMAAAAAPCIATVPCDCPFLDARLVARLAAARPAAEGICVAHDGERLQPVFALLATSLRQDLEAALAAGERKIARWYARHTLVAVDFSDARRMFDNLNTPEDLQAAEAALAG